MLKKVLDFMVANANYNTNAPKAQRGVQILLQGKNVTLLAVADGVTTKIELPPQSFSAGNGRFLLSLEDVADLMPPLQRGNPIVSISRSEQPLTKRPAVKFGIDDWFEAWLGTPCTGPSKSLRSIGEINTSVIKVHGTSLRSLSKGVGYKWEINASTKICEISLPDPIVGVKSVVKTLH